MLRLPGDFTVLPVDFADPLAPVRRVLVAFFTTGDFFAFEALLADRGGVPGSPDDTLELTRLVGDFFGAALLMPS